MRKLEGVESVEVSLQRGVADIRLRQGNSLTLARLRQLVRQNGFNARDAVVTVTGRLTTQGKAPALGVTGPDSVLILAADPAQRAAFDAAAARLGAGRSGPVTLEGTVRAGTNPASPDVLVVRRVVP